MLASLPGPQYRAADGGGEDGVHEEVERASERADSVHDHMTEEPYLTRLCSFKTGVEPAPIKTYPVLARGKEELKEVSVR